MEQGLDTTEEIPLTERQVWACSGEKVECGVPSCIDTFGFERRAYQGKVQITQEFLRTFIGGLSCSRDFQGLMYENTYISIFECNSQCGDLVSRFRAFFKVFEENEWFFVSYGFEIQIFPGFPNEERVRADLKAMLNEWATVYGFVLS